MQGGGLLVQTRFRCTDGLALFDELLLGCLKLMLPLLALGPERGEPALKGLRLGLPLLPLRAGGS
jgi:hypothetical protein